MATTTNNVHEELQALKSDFSKLRGDMSDLMCAVVDASKQKGTAAAERLHDSFEHVQKRSKQSMKQVETQVEEHPWTSMGAALGAGMIIGFLLRR